MDLRGGDVRGFHYKDGLCFYRQDDGGVRIEKGGIIVATVDAYSWASVIASMSEGGEDAKSYEQARDFHGCPALTSSTA